jgi:DNA (cytosine-5)-methyltransferase 1
MSWDDVSPTITAGCTTLSKGRFGHPEEHRTISALEAALLQTFPADYVFSCPYMEYVCGMIGNALPCDFAKALAAQCAAALRQYL